MSKCNEKLAIFTFNVIFRRSNLTDEERLATSGARRSLVGGSDVGGQHLATTLVRAAGHHHLVADKHGLRWRLSIILVTHCYEIRRTKRNVDTGRMKFNSLHWIDSTIVTKSNYLNLSSMTVNLQ